MGKGTAVNARWSKRATGLTVSMNTGSSFIYVISAPNGLVKIGISLDPAKRLKTLCTGSPVPLTLAHVFQVRAKALRLETEIHEKMAAKRSHGEWFRMAPDEAAKIVEDIIWRWIIKPVAICVDQVASK